MKREDFLRLVKEYVSNDPEVAAYIQTHVAEGINLSRTQAMQRAADMEAALAVMIGKRFNGNEKSFVLGQLKKWNGKSAIRWDSVIERLESNS